MTTLRLSEQIENNTAGLTVYTYTIQTNKEIKYSSMQAEMKNTNNNHIHQITTSHSNEKSSKEVKNADDGGVNEALTSIMI